MRKKYTVIKSQEQFKKNKIKDSQANPYNQGNLNYLTKPANHANLIER